MRFPWYFRRRRFPTVVRAPYYRRHPLIGAGLIVLVAWVYFDRSKAGGDRGRYHDELFNVVAVMDGDTFDVDLPDNGEPKTRIRLWGVDTPEVEGSPVGAMHFGAEASAFTKSLISGRKVRLVLSPTKSRDRYGRLLAYVYLPNHGDAMLNERLLETGHAYADWRFDHPHKRRFETLEKRAQSAKVGLWTDVQVVQMPEWRQRMQDDRKK